MKYCEFEINCLSLSYRRCKFIKNFRNIKGKPLFWACFLKYFKLLSLLF